ncbi:hypothetical protein ACP26L_17725 [Paenibacillus sp. S-38]|uniref:hypothetical protein n=1 Tax=Paenibacillus sp. S-38 TaxID=3416710 RepID=UPI003CE72C92
MNANNRKWLFFNDFNHGYPPYPLGNEKQTYVPVKYYHYLEHKNKSYSKMLPIKAMKLTITAAASGKWLSNQVDSLWSP